MEPDFEFLGEEDAKWIIEHNPGASLPDLEGLSKIMEVAERNWFQADCSDDYFGKTLPEQRGVKEHLRSVLGYIELPRKFKS